MDYLSHAAKHLLARLDNSLIMPIILNLALCVNDEQEQFFLPSAKLQALWLEQEIVMLEPHLRVAMIRDLAIQALKNMEATL